MGDNRVGDGVDEDVATAFGTFALTDTSLHEAARANGVTRWELEDAIEEAGLSETFDIEREGDVRETIDELLDD
ncbi:hypothetical protein GRX03_13270 [Halovenus sp. WSH3]|uniref:Uncharacterized protein n=1 Tax=Halovenus carboxidivorans TaxID=2692199 RepID=A0A6B0T3G9_9EURY|nr:hypothetical protein [Halovenus carboxidivorans]MXR52575.1 hypothetical protein [Halovenus carboxidivorans]